MGVCLDGIHTIDIYSYCYVVLQSLAIFAASTVATFPYFSYNIKHETCYGVQQAREVAAELAG